MVLSGGGDGGKRFVGTECRRSELGFHMPVCPFRWLPHVWRSGVLSCSLSPYSTAMLCSVSKLLKALWGLAPRQPSGVETFLNSSHGTSFLLPPGTPTLSMQTWVRPQTVSFLKRGQELYLLSSSTWLARKEACSTPPPRTHPSP